MGLKWHGSDRYRTTEAIEREYSFREFPTIVIANGTDISGRRDRAGDTSGDTFQAALKKFLLAPLQVLVTLNSQYNALFTKGSPTFKVGCTEFSTDVIAKLADALKSINE